MKTDYGLMDKYLADYIRQTRMKRNIPAVDLASRVGLSKQRYCNYESAIRSMPLDVYIKICEQLNIDAENLYAEAQAYMRKEFFK